jgi:hypothetical protein
VSIKSAACAVVMCLASSAALAQSAPLPAGPVAGLGPVMPPQEIGRILRARGFVPQATPVRNGEAYQVRAIDRFGRQVRLAIDARYGDILMVRPIVMRPPGVYGPGPYGYYRGYYAGYYRGYYVDEPPTGTVGVYPPPPGAAPPPARTATVAPLPRPKPAAKPAATTPPETPSASAPTSAAPAPAAPAPAAPAASAPPASDPAPTAALPPVAPLE